MEPPWLEHKPWQNPISSLRRTAGVGYSTLELDPYPGSIGGQVSGTVRVPGIPKADSACILRLSCIQSVPTGTDNDSDDNLLWSHTLRIDPRVTRRGLEVRFSFDEIPDDLPESRLPLAGHYVDWQLTLSTSIDGEDLRHRFSIPVFVSDLYAKTPARSASATEALLSTWSANNTWGPYRAEVKAVDESLLIRHGPRRGGMYQTGGWGGLVAIVVSFALSLTLLISANDELVSIVVTGVFGTLGLLVTGLAAYLWIRVVEIRVRPGWLSLDTFVLGRNVKSRVLAAEEIIDLEIRFSQLYVVSAKHGDLEIIDSIHDRKLLNGLRRLISTFLARR